MPFNPKSTLRKLLRRKSAPKTRLPEARPNLLILVYDSCRYDSATKAHTPVLDRYSPIYKGYTPATYTYPAHQSFFCGIFPAVPEPIPYYNRFVKQLIALEGGGDGIKTKDSFVVEKSAENIIVGLSEAGYYTVGSAGASWFAKPSLQLGFNDFHYTHNARALDQINLITTSIQKKALGQNFLGFINFMETHAPYMHYDESEYNMTARKKMTWAPQYNPDHEEYARKLHTAQIQAVEYLDSCLPKLFDALPSNTIVMLFADHGEAFGEDGYWGHGVYHEKVMEIPISIFSLDPASELFQTA
ncbi:MAG: sulfatase-like hydrolase/transferase [Elainellaceae cyanobacterium]